MIKINLFDTNGLIVGGENQYFNNLWKVPELVYMKQPVMEYDGITVFTDEQCFTEYAAKVKSKYKVAWAVESPAVKPHVYQNIHLVEDWFDYIYVCNPELHKNEKYKQCYFGACWLREEDCKIYEKEKLLSIVASNKNWAPGHQLRHEVIRRDLHRELDLWGSGYKWYENNSGEPFFPYMYNIVIENCQYPGYFTDKIVDCFAAGSIPIYWGAPDMDKLFNKDGFYTWNTIEELVEILDKISEEDYKSKKEAIEDNFKRFWEFASPDKWMLENCWNELR